jgi:hypothetical protein
MPCRPHEINGKGRPPVCFEMDESKVDRGWLAENRIFRY